MRQFLFILAAGVGLAGGAAYAQDCEARLSTLQASYSAADPTAILSAVDVFERGNTCNETTRRAALSQTSGVLAQRAQALLAAGDTAGAEALLTRAPALHWAIQALRADIAAKAGRRAEAASLYANALDTITDPAITPPAPQLEPVAARIATLAQENTMLAGSLDASITRSGEPRGVLRSAMRGIAIERIEAPGYADSGDAYKPDEEEYAATDDTYTPPPKHTPPADDYTENEETYTPPAGDDYAATDDTYTPPPADDYKPPKPETYDVVHPDPYATGRPEDYAVADAAAYAVTSVYLPINFAFGSADLNQTGILQASQVADFLIKSGIRRFTLVGHTDEVGSASFNLTLSFQRAETVRRFLQSRGVYADIHIDGRGESEPPRLSDPYIYNDEERRAIARRVELVLQG